VSSRRGRRDVGAVLADAAGDHHGCGDDHDQSGVSTHRRSPVSGQPLGDDAARPGLPVEVASPFALDLRRVVGGTMLVVVAEVGAVHIREGREWLRERVVESGELPSAGDDPVIDRAYVVL
jgi:hypothetical protein